MGVKIGTIPVDRGFYLILIGVTINYIIFAILMLMTASWRLTSINEALKLTAKSDRRNILRKMKILMKVLAKTEDLIDSLNNYLTLNNILFFLNFFITFLMISFLGYDILVHDLGSEDVIFFLAGVSFSFCGGLSCFIILKYSMTFNNTMQNSVETFNEISINSSDRKIKKFCQIANLQLSSTQNELSCGLLDFNWKFILTFLNYFFSYIVMMIQFDFMLPNRRIEISRNRINIEGLNINYL